MLTIRLTHRPAILLVTTLFCTGLSFAQKTMADLAKVDAKKIHKMIKIEKLPKERKSNYGSIPHLSKLSVAPERTALLSFYIYDPGTKKFHSGGIYRASSGYSITALTKDGAGYYAGKFYDEGFAPLKKAFQDNGFGLLTPAEYLDSEDDFAFYNNFTPKLSIISRAALSFTKAFAKAAGSGVIDVSATAPGYRLIKTPLQDPKLTASLNDLMNALDVDALVVVETNVKSEKKKYYLSGITMTMFGRNPVPRIPGKKYPGWSYQDCLQYGRATLNFKKPILFSEYDKKASKKSKTDVYREYYSGYSNAITRLGSEFTTYLAGRIGGKK